MAKTYREIVTEFQDFEDFKNLKEDIKKENIIVSAYNSIKEDIVESVEENNNEINEGEKTYIRKFIGDNDNNIKIPE